MTQRSDDASLRTLDPADPVKYDYSLCHLGMRHAKLSALKAELTALGIRDLAGNLSEWARDCKSGVQKTTQNAGSSCGQHVFVGSSWRDRASSHALDFSDSTDSDVGYTTIGFRVLRELDTDKPPPLVSPAGK